MTQWKNLNSSFRPTYIGDFDFEITLPVWQLSYALERPAVKGVGPLVMPAMGSHRVNYTLCG